MQREKLVWNSSKEEEQRMKREIIDASKLELEDKVVAIKRVTKVVKGGRNMRFTCPLCPHRRRLPGRKG